uniref:Ankyrin repeat and SOCS box containing 5a n=1 Tax=Hucho hucho TaxID=62062 RepID=A0A4W5K307_9TELE
MFKSGGNMTANPFALLHYSNVYLTILALFCFKLFIKIKEAARISAEFCDYGQGHRSWADRSPLHDAACQGRLLALRNLILQGHNVNVVTIDHVSPLHEACLGDHVACARTLIAAGANVSRYMVSPLHAAAEKDCTAIVKLLLDFGADIHARNIEFQRPVEVAPPSSLTEGFLLVYEATPQPLSQLCRQRIRDRVGRDRFHLINHLPLPNPLRNYLQYRW